VGKKTVTRKVPTAFETHEEEVDIIEYDCPDLLSDAE
jgi:hypothetical protein